MISAIIITFGHLLILVPFAALFGLYLIITNLSQGVLSLLRQIGIR
jgi:hypothetical protein